MIKESVSIILQIIISYPKNESLVEDASVALENLGRKNEADKLRQHFPKDAASAESARRLDLQIL